MHGSGYTAVSRTHSSSLYPYYRVRAFNVYRTSSFDSSMDLTAVIDNEFDVGCQFYIYAVTHLGCCLSLFIAAALFFFKTAIYLPNACLVQQ